MKSTAMTMPLEKVLAAEASTKREIDFSEINFQRTPVPHRPVQRTEITGQALSMTPKQIRSRARRKYGKNKPISQQEVEALYRKPLSQWDVEELARGRPRNSNGNFMGSAPAWLTRQMHEEAVTRFKAIVRERLNASTKDALDILDIIINNDEVDERGKPIVAASTKLDAIKFLVDHAVGKPTQRVEQDISVRLQGVLASAIVSPTQLPALPASSEQASATAPMYDAGGHQKAAYEDAEVVDDEEDD